MPRKRRSGGRDIIVVGASAGGLKALAATLLASQSEKIKEMLWISLRMFEERKNLLKSMGKTTHRRSTRADRQRLGETQGYIDRLRGMLVSAESQSPDDTFTRVKGLMAEPTKAKSTR
jgi:hypothetical protein